MGTFYFYSRAEVASRRLTASPMAFALPASHSASHRLRIRKSSTAASYWNLPHRSPRRARSRTAALARRQRWRSAARRSVAACRHSRSPRVRAFPWRRDACRPPFGEFSAVIGAFVCQSQLGIEKCNCARFLIRTPTQIPVGLHIEFGRFHFVINRLRPPSPLDHMATSSLKQRMCLWREIISRHGVDHLAPFGSLFVT